MSYGFSASNTVGTIFISEDFSNLAIVQHMLVNTGTYFQVPQDTIVMFRPAAVSGQYFAYYDNAIVTDGAATQVHVIFCATRPLPASLTDSGYGMVIYNTAGVPVFSSKENYLTIANAGYTSNVLQHEISIVNNVKYRYFSSLGPSSFFDGYSTGYTSLYGVRFNSNYTFSVRRDIIQVGYYSGSGDYSLGYYDAYSTRQYIIGEFIN